MKIPQHNAPEGYFSPVEEPGSIYRCFGQPERCPGGPPGTCASGRDTSSIACSSCLPGLHAKAPESYLVRWLGVVLYLLRMSC